MSHWSEKIKEKFYQIFFAFYFSDICSSRLVLSGMLAPSMPRSCVDVAEEMMLGHPPDIYLRKVVLSSSSKNSLIDVLACPWINRRRLLTHSTQPLIPWLTGNQSRRVTNSQIGSWMIAGFKNIFGQVSCWKGRKKGQKRCAWSTFSVESVMHQKIQFCVDIEWNFFKIWSQTLLQ